MKTRLTRIARLEARRRRIVAKLARVEHDLAFERHIQYIDDRVAEWGRLNAEMDARKDRDVATREAIVTNWPVPTETMERLRKIEDERDL